MNNFKARIKEVPSSNRKTRGSVAQGNSFTTVFKGKTREFKRTLTYEVWNEDSGRWYLAETILDNNGCWYKLEDGEYFVYLRSKNHGSADEIIDWILTDLIQPVLRNLKPTSEIPNPQTNGITQSKANSASTNKANDGFAKPFPPKLKVSQHQRRQAEKLFYESDSESDFYGFPDKQQSYAKSSLMVTKDFGPTTSKKTKESKLNHNNKNSTSNNAAAVSLNRNVISAQTKSGRTLKKPARLADSTDEVSVTHHKSPTNRTEQVVTQKKPSPKTKQTANKSPPTTNKKGSKKDDGDVERRLAEVEAKANENSRRITHEATMLKLIGDIVDKNVKAAVEPLHAAIIRQQKTIDEQKQAIEKLVMKSNRPPPFFPPKKFPPQRSGNVPSNVLFYGQKNRNNQILAPTTMEKRKYSSSDEESTENKKKSRKTELSAHQQDEKQKKNKKKKRTDIRQKKAASGNDSFHEHNSKQKAGDSEGSAQSKSGRRLTPNSRYGENNYICSDDIKDES